MATYPGAIPAIATPAPTDPMTSPSHSSQHGTANGEIIAIATELGTVPKGSYASVKARLDANPPTSVGTTAPSSPVVGQIWTDSTTTPYVGKVWNGTAWVIFSQPASGGTAWAVASGGTVTTFTGDGTNGENGKAYKVHTFTTSGSLVVSSGGAAELFMISAGTNGYAGSYPGAGGRVVDRPVTLSAGTVTVTVGPAPSGDGAVGTESAFGSIRTYKAPGYYGGAGATVADQTLGYPSSITGTAADYGRQGVSGSGRTNKGDGGAAAGGIGSAGIVIVRYQT